VAAAVLEALQPAGVQAAIAAVEPVGAEYDMQRRAVELALEKARYAAQRAQRQYDHVAPENRLVAGDLERRWTAALERVTEVAGQLATLTSQQRTLSEAQRQSVLTLRQDLSAVWQHPSAPEARKKRMLRTVLHEMIIDTTPEPPEHVLYLHWQGGVHTELRVARHTAGKHGRATDQDVIGVIRALAKVCRDLTSAATLNRLGYRTGTGKPWRAHRVACGR
jgi:hypothetical protein